MAKGKKTGGGSRRGSPNKHPTSFRTALREYCETLRVDPHRFMADLLANTDEVVIGVDNQGNPITAPAVKIELKFNVAKELAQYLEPKLKAVEHSGPDGAPILVHLEAILNMTPEERTARRAELEAKRKRSMGIS